MSIAAAQCDTLLGVSMPWEKSQDPTIMGGLANFLQGEMVESDSDDESDEHGLSSQMPSNMAAVPSSDTYSEETNSLTDHLGASTDVPEESGALSASHGVAMLEKPQVAPSHSYTRSQQNAGQLNEFGTRESARNSIEQPQPRSEFSGFDDFERALLREHYDDASAPPRTIRTTRITRVGGTPEHTPAPSATSTYPDFEKSNTSHRPKSGLQAQVMDEHQDASMYEQPQKVPEPARESLEAPVHEAEAPAVLATAELEPPAEVNGQYDDADEAAEEDDEVSLVDFSNVPEMRTRERHAMYSITSNERTSVTGKHPAANEMASTARHESVSEHPEEQPNSLNGLGISGTHCADNEQAWAKKEHEQVPPQHGMEETPPILCGANRTTAPSGQSFDARAARSHQHASPRHKVPHTSPQQQQRTSVHEQDSNRNLRSRASWFFRSVLPGNKSKRKQETGADTSVPPKMRWNLRDRFRGRNGRGTKHTNLWGTEPTSHNTQLDSTIETEPPAAPMRRANNDVPSPYYSPEISAQPSPGTNRATSKDAPDSPSNSSNQRPSFAFLFKKRMSDVGNERPSLSHQASNGILPMSNTNEEPMPVERELKRHESMMRERRRIHSMSNVGEQYVRDEETAPYHDMRTSHISPSMQAPSSFALMEAQPGLPPVVPSAESTRAMNSDRMSGTNLRTDASRLSLPSDERQGIDTSGTEQHSPTPQSQVDRRSIKHATKLPTEAQAPSDAKVPVGQTPVQRTPAERLQSTPPKQTAQTSTYEDFGPAADYDETRMPDQESSKPEPVASDAAGPISPKMSHASKDKKRLSLGLDENSWALDLDFDVASSLHAGAHTLSPRSPHLNKNPFIGVTTP